MVSTFFGFLVYCLAAPVLVCQGMVTKEEIEGLFTEGFKVHLVPIQSDIASLRNSVSNDLSELRINQDKKLATLEDKFNARFESMEQENNRRFSRLTLSDGPPGQSRRPDAVVTLVDPPRTNNNGRETGTRPKVYQGKPAKTGSSSHARSNDEQLSQRMEEQLSLAQVVAHTNRQQEAIDWEEEAKKDSRRGYRYRSMDHMAAMQATPAQIERAEAWWDKGARTIGLFPIDVSDKETAKEEIMTASGRDPATITVDEVDLWALKSFLEKDMGMPQHVIDELMQILDYFFYEKTTGYLTFTDRWGVQQVYKFAGLMNRMAARNRVERKLHLWIAPPWEQRFFALKRLEWDFRSAKKKKKQRCHTRQFYREGTIWAQWRASYEDEYQDIPEPASSMIPGIQYWRTTPHPRLNSSRGAPIHKPPIDAPTPGSRKRVEKPARGRGAARRDLFGEDKKEDSESNTQLRGGARGRGGVRGARGGGRGSARGGGRGGARGGGRGGQTRKENIVPAGGENAQAAAKKKDDEPAQSPLLALEDKSQPQNESMETDGPGNSKAASFAGMESGADVEAGKRRRGRPAKRRDSSAPQSTMKDFFKSVKPAEKRERMELDYDSDDMESEGESKCPRVSHKSPTKEETELYRKLATCLHKAGQLRPAFAKAKMAEYDNLFSTLDKESKYYESLRVKVLKGNHNAASGRDYELDCAMFEAQKWKVKNRLDTLEKLNRGLNDLADVEAKAIDHESPDTSINTSLDTSLESSVFTNDEDE